MGWWTARKIEVGQTDVVIGDKAADLLDEAIVVIQAAYLSDLGRRATNQELAALMKFCSGGLCNGVKRMKEVEDEDNHPCQPAQAEVEHQARYEQPRTDSEDLQG
jgi:hypothetical protein